MIRIRLLSKLGLLEPLVRLARWSEAQQRGAAAAPERDSVRTAPTAGVLSYDLPARSR